MEIVLLIIGIIIGTVVGYLAADRKSAALRAEISGTKKEIELLKLQKEEAEALHKRMNTEFENLSNRIFQSKSRRLYQAECRTPGQSAPSAGR